VGISGEAASEVIAVWAVMGHTATPAGPVRPTNQLAAPG